VLPDYLFVLPRRTTKNIRGHKDKGENYDSDDTLVDSEDEEARLKARATTEDPPSALPGPKGARSTKNGKTERYDDGA